jgi:hypothetical protein
MDRLRDESDYDKRRGAALGVAAVVYGLGVPCLKQYAIMQSLHVRNSLLLFPFFKEIPSFTETCYA